VYKNGPVPSTNIGPQKQSAQKAFKTYQITDFSIERERGCKSFDSQVWQKTKTLHQEEQSLGKENQGEHGDEHIQSPT